MVSYLISTWASPMVMTAVRGEIQRNGAVLPDPGPGHPPVRGCPHRVGVLPGVGMTAIRAGPLPKRIRVRRPSLGARDCASVTHRPNDTLHLRSSCDAVPRGRGRSVIGPRCGWPGSATHIHVGIPTIPTLPVRVRHNSDRSHAIASSRSPAVPVPADQAGPPGLGVKSPTRRYTSASPPALASSTHR